MCDCKKQTERRIAEALAEPGQLPKGSERIEARLSGYVFTVDPAVVRQAMDVEVQYLAPNKAGSLTIKKTKLSMVASYCMFCGGKYE